MSTFTVTNTDNSGAGSLRQQILNADLAGGTNIINFGGLFSDAIAHTINLTGSSLSITDNLTIEGTNASLLTIKDDSADRVFDIGKGVTSAINGLTIINTYDGAGGGGAISNEGVLTLSNSTITGNSAGNTTDINGAYLLGQGGGIYNTGSLTVNHSIISNNTANSGGGGIYNTGSLTVNHSSITDNTASSSGGGIDSSYNNANTITTINYSTIAGNTASTGLGGGIYNTGGSLTINHSIISNNTADPGSEGMGNFYGSGGGIYNTDSLTVNYSIISNNTANSGGGIEGRYDSNTTVNNSIISGNTAKIGGGIYIDISDGSQTLSVSNSSISDNRASDSGGGIGVGDYEDTYSGITITVSNSIISGNSALKGDGGGIYDGAGGGGSYDTTGAIIISIPGLTPNTLNVINSIISNNSAGADGGGIYNHSELQYEIFNFTSSTINVTNSIISGNSAGADGGSISNLGILIVTKSTISGNTALKGGGGIYNGGFTYPGYKSPDSVAYGNLTVSNSTISDNHASTGGGIYNHGTLLMNYSTISNNYATDYGGGIYNSSFNEFSSYNTLGIVTVSHSRISGNTAGTSGGGIYNDADQDFGKMVEFIKGTDSIATITYKGLGIVNVNHSTISGNQAHFGGGIYNNATLTVGNSIIRHNKAFGIELSSGQEGSDKGGGIYNSDSSYATATIDYSTIACNFDTPEEDSNKFIKLDNLVGKFITKGSFVRV
ncbi:beta strand repeat-containing protein [Nostoc sp.]|uniref:beta strand repeat-containing protein n=1 Tax=Nostoc sp. TaxID=1180 RepID=UPI002FFD1A52